MAKNSSKGQTARRIGRGLLARAKPRGMSAAIGGAAALAQVYAGENVEFIRDNWYGGPLAMFAGSLLVRDEKIATALAVLAGSSAVFNYKLSEFQQGKSQASPVPQFKAPAETKGLRDAGLRREPAASNDDAAMLYQ